MAKQPCSYSQFNTNYDLSLKLVAVGNSGVGKSSLLQRIANDAFEANYAATIGIDFRFVTVEKDGKIVKVQLWDTAGQQRFRTVTPVYYQGADGVAICFDLTNRASFLMCETWINEARRYTKQEKTEIILVGTKSDLCGAGGRRQVLKADAIAFAQRHGLAAYWETSAKSSEHVQACIHSLVDACLDTRSGIVMSTKKASTHTESSNVVVVVDEEAGGETSKPGTKPTKKELPCAFSGFNFLFSGCRYTKCQ